VTVLLDTHIWVWWLTASELLSRRERDALDQAASDGMLRISAISLWEAQMLHTRQRLELPLPFAEWLRRAADPLIVSILPLDLGVVLALDQLPATFHGDPADRLIVATASTHALPLATHDARIRRSRAVRIWRP
jgi:PIN domain nuclease of toxin-antitoxin system